MKVSEVNAATKRYDEVHLQKLVKEMYKRIPKKVRDEKGMDDLITDMDQFLAQIKQGKKVAPKIDFPVLKAEVDQFIADAEELYYP